MQFADHKARLASFFGALTWALAGSLMSGSLASASDLSRPERSLSGPPSRLERVKDAPHTSLKPQSTAGQLSSNRPTSALRPAAGPTTALREAEIPPERLERTRVLLQEFKAEPTPDKAISIDLPADVLFDFDKYELRPDARPSLDRAAELIKGYPNAPLLVRGHTDARGSDAYNDLLSERRAEAVALELHSRTRRMAATQGLGKREPVAPNTTDDGKDNPEGRQLNRRVQILIEPAPSPGMATSR